MLQTCCRDLRSLGWLGSDESWVRALCPRAYNQVVVLLAVQWRLKLLTTSERRLELESDGAGELTYLSRPDLLT